jgi:invasion protein IalB
MRILSLFILSLLPVLLACPAVSATVDGQGTVRSTHGAWQVNCGNPPGSAVERCAAVQSVSADDRSNVGLTVIFLKSADNKRRLLRIVAPLGVLLPSGLGLKIDNADVGQAPFLKCASVGCIAEVIADDALLEKLTKGTNAVFVIFQTPEAGIGIPVSLNGFSQALKELR